MGAAGSKEDEVFLDAISAQPEAVLRTPGGGKAPPVNRLYQRRRGTAEGGSVDAGLQGVWVKAATGVKWKFARGDAGDAEEEDSDEEGDTFHDVSSSDWYLVVPDWCKIHVSDNLSFRFNDDQMRVDFHSISKGPLALKMATGAEYHRFAEEYQRCKFENIHKKEYNEKNVNDVFGKDFARSWQYGEDSDEVMWDAGESFEEESKKKKKNGGESRPDYNEKFQEKRTPLGLSMGALENSFMLHEGGIDVFRNEANRVHSRGTTIKLVGASTCTPRKGLLIRGETGMLLMSPGNDDVDHSAGLRQLDLERETVVAQWKFEKDGTAINMRDVTGDSKGAQLEAGRSTFLGLDDNRLCRWDMRDKHGIVQDLTASSRSPALMWDEGHQFSRGTNFRCFATTGDGCIAVGSKDGKVRLYSTTSMRQAKTVFPHLGSSITHIDVTYDGHWVLATTRKFLVLYNTMWRDEKGTERSAFSSKGGSHVASPRLLRLLPQHEAVAGANYEFEKASFSWVTESGKSERHIVATVKQYSVIWNLSTVRKQDHECYRQVGLKTCTCYTVRELDESVVDSKFMNEKYMSDAGGTDAPLVVATPHKISSLYFQE